MRYFEDFYRAISPGNGGTTALQRLDGVMLARFPHTDAIGKSFTNSQRLLHDGVSGTVREPSPIDGLMRIKAAHILTNFPVLIVVTKTEEAALTNWRGIARLMSLGALGCVISIAVAAYAFGRQWTQYAMIADMQIELGRQEERTAAMQVAVSVSGAAALEMAYIAEHDFLTGLPNRLLLSDRIRQAIASAQRHKKKVAVLFLDLDGFKHINDSLGHSTGDKLLQSIAKRLVACVRGSDTVSRQGGDEFVVLLSEVEQSEDVAIAAKKIAQAVAGIHSIDQHDLRVEFAIAARRMLQAVAETHCIARHDLQVTASIGVSVYPDDGVDAETLIQNADTAMYQAKENGRQSYQFFQPSMNVLAVERQFIEESLGQALERREFMVHYQPVIDLRTGAISGAEALIRWMHPTRGLVPPVQFIAIAEDCGLMLPIGQWILREACRQAKAWMDEGLPMVTIAVNVSARQFRDESFLANLLATLSETGLDPKYLVLELTESVLIKRAEATADILQTVREIGARVAIDDFGTGYSSLSYLRKFPVDILKIDQSFVRQISTSDEDRAIVAAVVNMAHSLKLRVIAEGVEVLGELKFLRTHQCDEVQGYYFSGPVPADQFPNLLRAGIPKADYLPPVRAGFEHQTA
jgi:diguanylate cyclase (GGDEF)-like protein